jgi:hypothetical protein
MRDYARFSSQASAMLWDWLKFPRENGDEKEFLTRDSFT